MKTIDALCALVGAQEFLDDCLREDQDTEHATNRLSQAMAAARQMIDSHYALVVTELYLPENLTREEQLNEAQLRG